MTFLQMVQEVDRLLGSQGTISTIEGASVTEYEAMIAKYVSNAWLDIQTSRKDWRFMLTSIDISLTVSKQDYSITEVFPASAGVDPVGFWHVDRFLDSDDDPLIYIPFDQWIVEDYSNATQPRRFTVHDNTNTGYLSFESPDGSYTITAYYYAKPQILDEDADVPIAPAEYHKAIVQQGLTDVAAFLGINDIWSSAAVRANMLYGNLLRGQNPFKRMKHTRTFA